MPVVLTPHEVRNLLGAIQETMGLIAGLLYGTGMRLLECLRLRVKDVALAQREILVRECKGNKDRVTVLPENHLVLPLQKHLERMRVLHDADMAAGFGEALLPDALAMKYRDAGRSWGWQWVFASPVRSVNPRSGVERRHHIYPESVQRAVREAARQAGYDIRTV